MNKKILKKISLAKTMRFNVHYFGIKRLFRPYILIARNVTFKKLGGQVIVTNSRCGAVKIGFSDVGVLDEKYERTVWENTGVIEFDGSVSIGSAMRIICAGHLSIGNGTHFNGGTDVICWRRMSFGEGCLISWECLFLDTDFHALFDVQEMNVRLNPDKDVTIGNHVWVGCRTTVLKGVTVPDGSVIAACSRLTRMLNEANAIYVSNDIYKKNVGW